MIKETMVAWACLFAVCLNTGCPDPHTADRLDNLNRGAHHQVDLNKCYDEAVATFQTTQDLHKAEDEYKKCADAADADAGLK